MTQRLTRKQAAIIGSYTGYLFGPEQDQLAYIQSLPGLDQVTKQSVSSWKQQIHKASHADLLSIIATLSNDEDNGAYANEQFATRLKSLLQELHERFPQVLAGDTGYQAGDIEAYYLQAIDNLLQLDKTEEHEVNFTDRFVALLDELHKRFPHVKKQTGGYYPIELDYLKAIDTQHEPVPVAIERIDCVQPIEPEHAIIDTEALFKQAVNSLRPPEDKKGVHYATLRKTLDSVVAAYEQLKAEKVK